jgi:hypothetical protein
MSKVFRQTNFSAGELAPGLWGRTDLPAFQSGARRMRNMFPTREGKAVSRPGTVLIRQAKSTARCLIPFIVSDDGEALNNVLEFGINYMRVHTAEGTVLTWDESTYRIYYSGRVGTFTVGATITGADSGHTAEILADEPDTDPGYEDHGVLTISSADDWHFQPDEEFEATGGATALMFSGSILATVPYELVTPFAEPSQYVQSGDVMLLTVPSASPAGGAWELRRLAADSWSLQEFNPTLNAIVSTTSDGVRLPNTLPTADDAHPAREWHWRITEMRRDSSGLITESAPVSVSKSLDDDEYDPLVTAVVLYPDKSILLTFADYTPDAAFVSFVIYRGRGGMFGYIGETTSNTFRDVGDEPDYSQPPPLGDNPLYLRNSSGAAIGLENARAVAYYQERLVFAGSATRPQRFWTSRSGDYLDFDPPEPQFALPDSPLEYELASRRREEIRSLLTLDRLLFFTSAAVWAVSGSNGEPLAWDSIDVQLIDEVGASVVSPLVVDGCALYVRVKGNGVRAIVPGGERGYTPLSLSSYASHLFTGRDYLPDPIQRGRVVQGYQTQRIISWCYADDPWGLVWAVRSDGVLLSLCFDRQGQQWGWSWHDTDPRYYDHGFGPFLHRTGRVYDVCSIPYEGEDVVFLFVYRENDVVNGVGHNYIERMVSRVRMGGAEDDFAVDSAIRYRGPPTQTITGLEHLESQYVWAVARGNPIWGPMLVVDGQVTLSSMPTPYDSKTGAEVQIHVGLKFTPQLETLDLGPTQLRTRDKNVVSVSVEVEDTLGVEVGEDFENLTAWKQREPEDGFDRLVPETAVATVIPASSWNQHGRVVVQQSLPAPLTVLGVTREVDAGD